MIRDGPVPKEPGQQSKRMVRQSWIDERLLAFQGFNRAAARLFLILREGIDQLWKDFRHGSEPCRGTPIHPIPRLPENKLSAGRVVSKIEPIENSASLSGRTVCDECRAARLSTHPITISTRSKLVLEQKWSGIARQFRFQNRLRRETRITAFECPTSDWLKGCRMQFVDETTSPSINVTSSPSG
jgi:hypothetical protein